MLPELHSVKTYKAFDAIIQQVRKWSEAQAAPPPWSGVPSFSRRLVQRIVEVGLRSFVCDCARRFGTGTEPLPRLGTTIKCGGLVINSSTGQTRPRPGLLARSIGLFLVHWLHVLGVHLLALVRRTTSVHGGSATLVYGVGRADLSVGGSDARFIEFCRRGPIDPLRSARRLIVQAIKPIQSTRPQEFYYHRFPLFALVLVNPPSPILFLRFLKDHLRVAFSFGLALVCYPTACILARDFAYHAMVHCLNRRRLIENVIITNTNYTAQPLWMRDYPDRNYSTHMVWYSQNNIPFVYAADPVSAPLPSHRYLAFDQTWVWTEGYARYLRELGITVPIHVVGPILWYLPEVGMAPIFSALRVAVFDVTPVNQEFERNYGLAYNYYGTTNMTAFMRDLVVAVQAVIAAYERPVRLLLKHKRDHSPIHDQKYIRAVEELARQSGLIDSVPPGANMFDLLAGCDAAVVIPYSSPAYVAAHVKTPAIYYDPTGSLEPRFESAATLRFVAGRGALTEALLDALKLKTPHCADVPAGPQNGSICAV